jgi:Cof subfamily protein (haloacid dehalogenase superfamily)
MPIKLICFDFDGTLFDETRHIHPADVEILSTYKDALLVPATGRTIRSVRQIFEKNGIFIKRPIPFPMIIQNGTVIYGYNENILDVYYFDADTQSELTQLLFLIPFATHLFFELDEIYSLYENHSSTDLVEKLDFITQPYPNDSQHRYFTKVMCLSLDQNTLVKISDQTKSLNIECLSSLPYALEITPAGVNKASGVIQLINGLGHDDYEIYAVGDGENDLPLLSIAHMSFAPITSCQEVLSKVDYVIDPRDKGIFTPILKKL